MRLWVYDGRLKRFTVGRARREGSSSYIIRTNTVILIEARARLMQIVQRSEGAGGSAVNWLSRNRMLSHTRIYTPTHVYTVML